MMSCSYIDLQIIDELFVEETLIQKDWQLIKDKAPVLSFDVLVNKLKDKDAILLDVSETMAGFGIDIELIAKVPASAHSLSFNNNLVQNANCSECFKVVKVKKLSDEYFSLSCKSLSFT